MERANIKAASQICQFRSLGDRAQAIVIQNLRKDTDYSDAPEEFKGSNSCPIWRSWAETVGVSLRVKMWLINAFFVNFRPANGHSHGWSCCASKWKSYGPFCNHETSSEFKYRSLQSAAALGGHVNGCNRSKATHSGLEAKQICSIIVLMINKLRC